MLRISQIKCELDHTPEQLREKIRKKLRLSGDETFSYEIVRQSVDARHKDRILYVYTVDVSLKNEGRKRLKLPPDVERIRRTEYTVPRHGQQKLRCRPVITGSGPAGLFCALLLAREGYRPLILERGARVEERRTDVERFWEDGRLDPDSNVQFGEGGAGTFSDGKLNTLIKDQSGRIRFVLETFVNAGAAPDILYSYKPHMGTDVLCGVIRNIREEITRLGGTFLYRHTLTDIQRAEHNIEEIREDGTLVQLPLYHLKIKKSLQEAAAESSKAEGMPAGSTELSIDTQLLVLAIGHSARDTYRMLYERQFPMQPKAFAVGVRVQHSQELINRAMYGDDPPLMLGAAPYKLTCRVGEAGVYSFCMCPGGYVVNASSEEGYLAVNGMSYHDRGGINANSAIVVTVSPEDYGAKDALDGIAFARKLEKKAWEAGSGKIPVQRLADFKAGRPTKQFGDVKPQMKGGCVPANIRPVFPERIADCIEEGMEAFGKKIDGFDADDTLLSAVESRTSSPVRIRRDEEMMAEGFEGIYPCGEGAGYAGGITSAAVDGLKVAEQIIKTYSKTDLQI